MTLLPGARELLAFHACELPQRDDLCGAFCAALALRAAGISEHRGEPVDQDAVAICAGSVVCAVADAGHLPHGEQGRRDYRLAIPFIEDSELSGTTAGGVVRAVAELSDGRLRAVPYSGPWTPATLAGLFDVASTVPNPVALVANLATGRLWGSHPRADQLLGYLLDGDPAGPPPDWEVGHFTCVVGRLRGPGGELYAVADTYPSLGRAGVHLQPREHLAMALKRPGMPPGGMIAIALRKDASHLRAGGEALGLIEGLWDNGTIAPERTG